MSEINDLIRKIRGKDSLRKATEKTGISYTYWSILEKGVDPRSNAPVKPTPDTLKSISNGYNYSYEELMRVAGYIDKEPKDPTDLLIEYLDAELTDEEIIEKMDFYVDGIKLTDDDVRDFVAFVRAKRFTHAGKKQ